MGQVELVELVRQAILATAMIVLPVVLVGFLVGGFMGMVQSASGVQEPIIGFLPRLLAMAAALFLATPWMVERLVEFLRTAAGP